jgi:hypothetical protein
MVMGGVLITSRARVAVVLAATVRRRDAGPAAPSAAILESRSASDTTPSTRSWSSMIGTALMRWVASNPAISASGVLVVALMTLRVITSRTCSCGMAGNLRGVCRGPAPERDGTDD